MEAFPSLKTLVSCLIIMFGASWAAQAAAAEEPPEEPLVTVNINAADAETLAEVLDGIGVRRAEAIIEYREVYGPFYQAEELTAVKGIGAATVAANLNRIQLE